MSSYWLNVILQILLTVGFLLVGGDTSPVGLAVQIVLWSAVLISTVYATEVSVALSGARLWWNVFVVSTVMTIPQTVAAVKLATEGYYIAAWVDTIGSTVVDAVLVTAAVRRRVIGTPLMWLFLPNMILWSVFALGINWITYNPWVWDFEPLHYIYLMLGYVVLPGFLVWRAREAMGGIPPLAGVSLLVLNTLAMGVGSWELVETLKQLPVSQAHLGVIATILATLPDLLVALFMRVAFAAVLSEEASEYEMVATMLAGAIHDQISVPALMLLFVPQAAQYYPHVLNVLAVIVKFFLLNRRLFWLVGFPMAIAILLMPPV